jgi:pimeloyl-ACP methyl ester carboxylesterase
MQKTRCTSRPPAWTPSSPPTSGRPQEDQRADGRATWPARRRPRIAGGEEIQKGIKGATLIVFEESGHTPQLEESDAVNAVLVKFLRQ